MLAGLAFCEMLSQSPRSAFQGLSGVARGSATVCDPNPLRPFARNRERVRCFSCLLRATSNSIAVTVLVAPSLNV